MSNRDLKVEVAQELDDCGVVAGYHYSVLRGREILANGYVDVPCAEEHEAQREEAARLAVEAAERLTRKRPAPPEVA